jgi:hypothetical protein
MTQVPVPVTLTTTTDPQGQLVWQMGINGAAPQGPPYPPITVAHGNTAVITFSIQNGPGQTIAFASNPMLVPPKTKGLDAPTVNGTSMSVTDHNLSKGEIPYVLVFNGAPKLDPIINNDGGGTLQYYFSNPLIDFLGLAIVAAFIFFVARPLLRKGP